MHIIPALGILRQETQRLRLAWAIVRPGLKQNKTKQTKPVVYAWLQTCHLYTVGYTCLPRQVAELKGGAILNSIKNGLGGSGSNKYHSKWFFLVGWAPA
jgi:hypothetical protein